jgi:hypothetical protein
MLRLEEFGFGNYKMKIHFTWPAWTGDTRWLVYLDVIGFYHVQISISVGASIDLGSRLAAKIKKHAAP